MGIKAFPKIRVFIPIILSLSLLIINPSGLRDILFRFIIPFKLMGLKIKPSSSYGKDHTSLKKENERLKAEIASLFHRYAKIDEVFLENQRLKEILSFKEKSQFRLIVANALSFNSSTIIIDRGMEDGIKKGFGILSQFRGKEVFIGRVIKVFPSSSLVLLTTDIGFLLPVRLKNSREKGLLVGQMDKMELKFIEKQTPVILGEPIITIADSFIPDGILVGYVKNIKDEIGLFKKVFVKPPISFSALEEVLVLVPL